MSYLSVETVTKSFKNGDETTTVLAGLNLSMGRGEIIMVMGPSGSGKTTLINVIGGIERPDSGRIVLDGTEVTAMDNRMLNDYRRNDIGFVFQFYNLIPNLTAQENVMLALEGHDLDWTEKSGRAIRQLELVNILDKKDRFPQELSAGQQQRVALARALVKQPKLILADEPTGNLDEATETKVIGILAQVREELGTSFIIVSHNSRLRAHVDRCYELRKGVLVEN
ncbi:MAG: putative ABC transporter ATP-binding protein [Methanomassiliicoccales archaeon PtaU1.Bin124]|nr:MAG: putative ABC transporter ATP-binding protein [Methanomassiliicoccales archaeon PtaU1.Bin124]